MNPKDMRKHLNSLASTIKSKDAYIEQIIWVTCNNEARASSSFPS